MESNSREFSKQALKFEISVCTLIKLIAYENSSYEVMCDKNKLLGTESVSRNDVRPNDNRRSNPDCILKCKELVIIIDAKNFSRTKIAKHDIEKSRQDGQVRGSNTVILVLQEECALQDCAYKYCLDHDMHLIQLVKAGGTIRNASYADVAFVENEYINKENMKTLKIAIEKLCIPPPLVTFTKDDKIDRTCKAIERGYCLEELGYIETLDGTVDKRYKVWKDYAKYVQDRMVSNYNHEVASAKFKERKDSRDSNSSREDSTTSQHLQDITQICKPIPRSKAGKSQPKLTHNYNTRSKSCKAKEPVTQSKPATISNTVIGNELNTLKNIEESFSNLKINSKGMQPVYNYSDSDSSDSSDSSDNTTQTYQYIPYSNHSSYRDTSPPINPTNSQIISKEPQTHFNKHNIIQDSYRYHNPISNSINNCRPQKNADYIKTEIPSYIPNPTPPIIQRNHSITPQALLHEQSIEVLKQFIKKQPNNSQNNSMNSQSRSYSNSESMFFYTEIERMRKDTSYIHPSQSGMPVQYSRQTQSVTNESQFFKRLILNLSSSRAPHMYERSTLT